MLELTNPITKLTHLRVDGLRVNTGGYHFRERGFFEEGIVLFTKKSMTSKMCNSLKLTCSNRSLKNS